MSSSTSAAFVAQKRVISARVTAAQLGFKPAQVWNPSPSKHHRVTPYDLPQSLTIGLRGTEESGAKFSPPPFAVVVENDEQKALVAVTARPGWHRWNRVDFHSTSQGVKIEIDTEGHSDPATVASKTAVHVVAGQPGETRHALLARGLKLLYPAATREERQTHDWWFKPIYCGWGDQVTIAQYLEGVGAEARALAYCTQGLYERWIKRLDEAGVPFGTTIIDAGWSRTGVWEPDTILWPDLKGFIAREHEKGRKVLLWIGTWLNDGLDARYCTKLDGQPLSADPTNPAYMKLVRQWVQQLIGPDGYDADGFKIDQLAWSPTHHKSAWVGPRFGAQYPDPNLDRKTITFHGQGFGMELLHKLQKNIYTAAKSVKPDCLVTSSTVHPYFHDTLDMVRIHDMGNLAEDIFEAMKARVDLAQAVFPGIPIDTDDWIHSDYDTWLRYTAGSHVLGVPCIFYAEHFMLNWQKEPATKLIPIRDLKKIAAAWRKHVPALAD